MTHHGLLLRMAPNNYNIERTLIMQVLWLGPYGPERVTQAATKGPITDYYTWMSHLRDEQHNCKHKLIKLALVKRPSF